MSKACEEKKACQKAYDTRKPLFQAKLHVKLHVDVTYKNIYAIIIDIFITF